jgi:hypothetical protein
MQSAQTLPRPVQTAVDEIAPVNRFYVTVDPVTREEVDRGVEVLRQRDYNLCWPVLAMTSEDAGFVTVTGYSFRGYALALKNAVRFTSQSR